MTDFKCMVKGKNVSCESIKLGIGDNIKIRDDNMSPYGYTIFTPNGTLWRNLPKNYILEGKVVKSNQSFYQSDNNVTQLHIERTSPSPAKAKLRSEFVIWQRNSNNEIIY